MTEPLTPERLKHYSCRNLLPWEAEKICDTALHFLDRLREVEAMLVVSEQHTEHWQDRALAAEAERDRLVGMLGDLAHHPKVYIDVEQRAEKAEAEVAFRDEAIKNLGAEIKRLQARAAE